MLFYNKYLRALTIMLQNKLNNIQKKKCINYFCFILIFLSCIYTNEIFARRVAPQQAEPIHYNGVIYSSRYDHGGIIEARDKNTKKLLWKKQIYFVKYHKHVEKDIQEIFITKIIPMKRYILIMNEKNETYKLFFKTHKIMLIPKKHEKT